MIVFRPRARFYIREVFQIAFGIAALVVMVIAFGGIDVLTWAMLPCGLWPMLFIGTGAYGFYKLTRSCIEIDEQGLKAQFHDAATSFTWPEVLYTRQLGQFLEIWIGQEPQLINLKLFDKDSIWDKIEVNAVPSSLANIGAKNIGLLQKRIDKYERLLALDNHQVLFQHRRGSTLMWCCIPLSFLAIHLLIWLIAPSSSGAYLLVVTLPIGLFSLLMAWNRSLIFEISTKGVSLSNRLVRKELSWEDIQVFTASRGSYSVIFASENRRLFAPGINEWGDAEQEIFDMLMANLWWHQIEIRDLTRITQSFQLAQLPRVQQI